MRFEAPEAESRRAFSATDKHNILLRQAIKGADGVYRAFCAGDGCGKEIALLEPDGRWKKLLPFDFDHKHERSAGGKTDAKNGQALCSGPETCHAAKTAEWAALSAAADRKGGRSGQYARRAARKAAGMKPLLSGRRFGE